MAADINQYNTALNGLFNRGTTPPKEPGVYYFSGKGFVAVDGEFSYEGVFKRLL